MELQRTLFHGRHVSLGATMVEFGGWDMPVQYAGGIVQEHLATRRSAGLFDVSHMGRFRVGGPGALPFLQHVLTNNAAALDVGEAQYTMVPDPTGGAIDDAYLYRFLPGEFLLVVNASNRLKDWEHFRARAERFSGVELSDRTAELAMLSVQGPSARSIVGRILSAGGLPEPMRNRLSLAAFDGAPLMVARTGYTGEPIGFELFASAGAAPALWDRLVAEGALPVGLGARDTLRLEAGLPLYGHELGLDPEGRAIPIFACGLARFAVSFAEQKGEFVGREALRRQFEALKGILERDFDRRHDLPRWIQPIALLDKGVARAGARVLRRGQPVGFVTSGTMVPYWIDPVAGIDTAATGEKAMRAIGMALLDSDLAEGDEVEVDIRGRLARAAIVPYHLRNEAPPVARPIPWNEQRSGRRDAAAADERLQALSALVRRAAHNHAWRRNRCVNLIPSEQTPSALVARLSITDPAGRYAEHKPVKALKEAEVFYYQGTDFIGEVERLLAAELKVYLECSEIEARTISGQMANMAVFSAMVDWLNRGDRRCEQARLRKVMNHHIIKGGHLSAQPMGALRDFVMRDPSWEKPAVVNFPVIADNPYQIDLAATRVLLAEHRPELIVLGKSMTLHREPVAEIRAALTELRIDAVLMVDMAHVLGLVGPHFQRPFAEGADVVTGSTHKTFFGTQRGVIGSRIHEQEERYELWEAVRRRTFPGSVSNHHLGTLLGLLVAAYEMNHFKDA
ncbi:MAG TPA: glycine cleavage system aminomethyltransferase GcvT, partial [Desulfobacterales bacterium]|nr:glycine cleavage system aminomethyltransferase GcvT [Desulfobacterales bacterium]